MDKAKVLEAVLLALDEEFERLKGASEEIRGAGNDAESKSDGKYDTRSTEANYLADGQARQAELVALAAGAFRHIGVVDFPPGSEIATGALVELDFGDGEREWFLLGPASGGLEVVADAQPVTVITSESPLGSRLIGNRLGESLTTPAAKISAVV